MKFYRFKLDEINALLDKKVREERFIQIRQTKKQLRLNELNNFSRQVKQPVQTAKLRHHILLSTYAETATTGKVEVNYLVPNAGWIPAYDLRADKYCRSNDSDLPKARGLSKFRRGLG